jgi:fatty-acyl-CoA synthase
MSSIQPQQTLYSDPGAALDACAARWPNTDALVFPQAAGAPTLRLTFDEWRDQALRVAAGLHALGLRRGDPIAIWAENRIEWPVAQLAFAYLGAILVPVNTHFREMDLAYVLEHSGAKAILLSERFRANEYLSMVSAQRASLPKLKHVICFDEQPAVTALLFRALTLTDRTSFTPAQVGPRDIASIQYTSGTTGRPKGAALCFEGIMMNAYGSVERLRAGPGDRWTSIIPLFHCAGCIMNVLGSLSAGATYVGVPAFDPELMFKVIESEHCTMLTGVPTSFLAMLQHPKRAEYDMRSLRAGTCGGADCDPQVMARCAQEFPIPGLVQVYGQTEASTLISADWVDDPERFATSGNPIRGMEARITDPTTRVVLAPDALGQIELRGKMITLGYHDQPEETAKTIDVEGWMQTGDLGYLTKNGKIVVAGGRLRDIIIRGGENIYPVEVENLMREHPAITEIAVFGLPDEYYGEIVAAAVQLNGSADAASLKGFCADKIARFKHPVRFFSVETFPMTSSGKIRKRDLVQLARENKLRALD